MNYRNFSPMIPAPLTGWPPGVAYASTLPAPARLHIESPTGGPIVSNGNINCQNRISVMPVGTTFQPNGNYGTGNWKCMTLDDCICLGGPFPVFNTGDRVEQCTMVQDPNHSCPNTNPPTPCAPPPMIQQCKYGTIDSRRGTKDLDAMHNGCPYLDNNCTPGSTQNYPDLPTVTNYGITWDDGTTTWDYKPTASNLSDPYVAPVVPTNTLLQVGDLVKMCNVSTCGKCYCGTGQQPFMKILSISGCDYQLEVMNDNDSVGADPNTQIKGHVYTFTDINCTSPGILGAGGLVKLDKSEISSLNTGSNMPIDNFMLLEEEVPAGSKVTIQFGDGCGPFKNPTQGCTMALQKFTGMTTGRMANRSSDGTQTWEVDWGLSPSDGTPTLSWHPVSDMIEIIPPTPTLPPLPVEVIDTTTTTKTAGVGGDSKFLIYLLVAGGLYYAYSQGMLKKLIK